MLPSYVGVFANRSAFTLPKGKYINRGLTVQYVSAINGYINLSGALSAGFAKMSDASKSIVNNQRLVTDVNASFQYNLSRKKALIVPYLQTGVSASKFQNHYGVFLPVGGGIKFNVWKDGYLSVQSEYRQRMSGAIKSHFAHSIGIAGLIKNKHRIKHRIQSINAIQFPQTTIDKSESRDSDGDGILDSIDKCPLVPGFAGYGGCPVPDTDQDGINDDLDSCMLVPGVARYRGCPIPDRDHDGVNDEVDKCIDTPGIKENQGCPIIKLEIIIAVNDIAKEIFFETASYSLKEVSLSSLDHLAKILQSTPAGILQIEGHTDNAGKRKANQLLSQQRAETIKTYLINKGINASRLTSVGFGQDRPVDTNATESGRSKNRRVELKIN